MSVGSRIRELRKKKGLTQKQLAEKVGVTANAITNYETGISSPKVEILYKIIDALECDANYLYQDDIRIMRFEEVKEHSTGFDFSDPEEQIHALEQSYKAQKIIPLDETLSLNTTIEDWQILLINRQLNEEGREKLINYGVDLVMSGRHKKSDKSELVENKA